MEQLPSYNLLQAIDPTKIKVPISDRFAKLTLSSNKKKQQPEQYDPEDLDALKLQQEKRDSVSRDISKQFDQQEIHKNQQNPLLRSESSKETECRKLEDANDEEITMDPLEVSEDYDNPTQLGEDVELLSQQIASMVVDTKPTTLSSGSTDNLSIFSQFTSTESQRSSTSEGQHIHIVHNIPINVKEALKQETIPLNLTSSTNNNYNDLEKTYEMTDDEDDFEKGEEGQDEDEEESEEGAITISDTSESHHEQEPDVMAISSLPSTILTSESFILPDLTDNKAERVAAFLRDVSREHRVLVEQGHVDIHDTVDQLINHNEIVKIQETLVKSRQIAAADTESMTPDADEEIIPKSMLEREKRLKSLAVTIEEENNSDKLIRKKPENVHILANDETQDNTILTSPEEFNDVHKTPQILANLKTSQTHNDNTPKSSHTNGNHNMIKLPNDETQCNIGYSLAEDCNSPQEDKSRRLAALETEPNTEYSLTDNKEINVRRLVNDETVENSIMTGLDDALTQPSIVYNYSQDYKTPEKGGKTITNDETRSNSSISIHSSPQSSTKHHKKSFASVIDSSRASNASTPELSITISETDEESVEQQKSPAKSENSDDKKLSNSFHRSSSSDEEEESEKDVQMSKIQMSMASINISAKINIKIHIPDIVTSETSEDEQMSEAQGGEEQRRSELENIPGESNELDNEKEEEEEHSTESNDQRMASELTEMQCKQKQLKVASVEEEKPDKSPNSSTDSVEMVEDKKFLTEAEKLLNQLYGKSWQTPEVIRTLKCSSQSGEKKSCNPKSSSRKKDDVKDAKENKSNGKSKVEDSILDDFSIFRRNIVKTNLDSTRLATPKSAFIHNKEICTEPRNTKQLLTLKEKTNAAPQTERKHQRPAVAKVVINKGRVNKNRWRQLVDDDSNSEGDNASDDDDADVSWSKNASEIEKENSDSDFENSPKPKARNRKNNTTNVQGRSDKSDKLTKILNKSKEGEIVYLDLSKEEVEVQDEVPESPPANHDETFASRLKDVLQTCRHEDKAKLPSSSQKTKRKLFTPIFGDDEFETVSPKEKEEETKAKENREKTPSRTENFNELVVDTGICPFDSQGRPKVLDLYNKQLESVRTGKLIFQLTPSPKKKSSATPSSNKQNDKNIKGGSRATPKTKGDNEAVFKTPLNVKTKGPPKSWKELSQTPDYKYSFLKSLDVTVSKAFCHPDALYYRDNYRTKKEDLAKILYDMYNEKLFSNKLLVPITWNKKLLNTAGRCLNKKRMGLRSSAIELSDKVLTSSDRLRCTLIHELCHAATWIFAGEGGHGSTWKEWARRANATFPEIPKIGVCHQYDIEYKYTYKCTLCAAKSHTHSKSKKVENIRCSFCHGAIEVFLNKKDKDGNIMPTPVKEPTGFAKFVKDNYKKFKRDDLKHTDVMKLLSSEFASLKVAN